MHGEAAVEMNYFRPRADLTVRSPWHIHVYYYMYMYILDYGFRFQSLPNGFPEMNLQCHGNLLHTLKIGLQGLFTHDYIESLNSNQCTELNGIDMQNFIESKVNKFD